MTTLNARAGWALGTAAGLLAAGAAGAGQVAPGDLLVYRVGTGTGSLLNTGAAVFVDEFGPTGALVQSIPLPTAAVGAQAPLIASGTASSEGLISLSADGRYAVVTGYGATIPTAGLAGTAAATVPRVIGRIALATGAVDTSTALADYATGNNPRSAASTDGTTFFAVGGAGGVRTAGLGATTSSDVSTTATNLRQASVFAGQLYVSSGSGAIRLGAVGAGTSTTAGQTITALPGLPTTGATINGFFFADLTPAVAGLDTLYVAVEETGLSKYTFDGATWVLDGTVGAAADTYRGVYGQVTGASVALYATRKGGGGATGGGELVALTDASGYDGTLAGTPTLLSTAATNTAYRGVVAAPVPEPGAVALLAVGALAFARRRRRA